MAVRTWSIKSHLLLRQSAQADTAVFQVIRLAAYTGTRRESICSLTVVNVMTDRDTAIRHLCALDAAATGWNRLPRPTAHRAGECNRMMLKDTAAWH
jgi:hypothetical protein